MRTKVKLWMLPLGLILSFTLTTCVVAAFADDPQQEPTQCFFGTVYMNRDMIGEYRYVMDMRIMVYKDQEAAMNWAFPDVFICTRR